jgi:hypothetical protein
MRNLTLACTCALFLLLAGCEMTQAPKAPTREAQQAAQDGVVILQQLVTTENYKAMGFDSVEQVKQAQLGPPMTVFNIPLDLLKSYKSSTDPNSLLEQSTETIYPVSVNGQVKSSVTIVKKDNGYTPSSFGNAPIAAALAQYGANREGGFVVRVPALNFYFVGQRERDRLMLVSIVDDPRLKMKAGEAVPADLVLLKLAVIANDYNGLPM